MGGLRRVDKACKKCGAMMYQVPSKRLYCDKCRDTVPRNMSKTEEKPKKLTLSEIMREADKEGLQYASYCKKARTLLRKKSSGRCSESTGKSSLLIPSEGRVKMRKRRRFRFWPMRITARKVTFM